LGASYFKRSARLFCSVMAGMAYSFLRLGR
jgi:hypothetical protein